MRASDSTLLPLDLKTERTERAPRKAKIEALLDEQQWKEKTDMKNPPRHTFEDYCRCTEAYQIS